MVHHEFTTFSQKDYISHFGNAWETLDYKARRSSSTVAISGCHSANLWIGKKMLQMVLQIVFFLAILNRKTTIYASFFAPEKLVFCISSCSTLSTCFVYFFVHQIVLLFAFLRAPYRVFFCVSVRQIVP